MSSPPMIIVVHGVGLWPGIFDQLCHHLPQRQMVWIRPGYQTRPSVSNFQAQVDALASVATATAPSVIVGVSGGATLALGVAINHIPGLQAIVTHEPLVGPLEPKLHARLRVAAAELDRQASPETAIEFLANLYGRKAWDALPEIARTWAAQHWASVATDVAQFASFSPTIQNLESIDIPHITTVGSFSPPDRHSVASLLNKYGAAVEVLEGAGHLAPVETPAQLATAVVDVTSMGPL